MNRILSNLDEYAQIAFPKALEIPRSKKHISLIVNRKGSVLAIGDNNHRVSAAAARIGYRYDEAHSELDAFSRLSPNLRNANGLILLNFRFNRFGDIRMSKPCSKCMPWCSAIFRRIVYTTRAGYEVLIPNRDELRSISLPSFRRNVKAAASPGGPRSNPLCHNGLR